MMNILSYEVSTERGQGQPLVASRVRVQISADAPV